MKKAIFTAIVVILLLFLFQNITFYRNDSIKADQSNVENNSDSSDLILKGKRTLRKPVKTSKKIKKSGAYQTTGTELSFDRVDSIDMSAPGIGEALHVSLKVKNGALKVTSSTSVPEKVISRQKIHIANHFMVIKDANGMELLKEPVQLHRLRAPLLNPDLPQEPQKSEPLPEEYSGFLVFKKFSQIPGFIELYRLKSPYFPDRSSQQFTDFLKNNQFSLLYRNKLR